jgi:hypothetical protein
MPGGTPKRTAQVEESLRRPRKRPGRSKLPGEATGTRTRFLETSHWPMLASRFVGTSETSMSSTCARHALSEGSLRASTEANVLLPFIRHSLSVPYPWWGEDTRCGESVGKPLRTFVGEMIATQPRSEAGLINFRERRKAEVRRRRIRLPRIRVNKERKAPQGIAR